MNPRSPKISVVIPTYTRSTYVLETVKSVLAQTLSDLEVIVANLGSTDNTAQNLGSLRERGLVRYIEQQNQGIAAARNHGLKIAKGRFVGFLDDDDLWVSDKLEWQIAYLNENPNVGIIGGSSRRRSLESPIIQLRPYPIA